MGPAVFANNNLTNVNIIWTSAFDNNDITSVTIPNNVDVRLWAFRNNAITNVTIGAGVTLAANAIGFGFEAAYASHGSGTFTRPNAASNVWTHTPP